MTLLHKENDLQYNAMLMREKRELIPDTFAELSQVEKKRKKELLETGFTTWTKNDFLYFVRASEKFGRFEFEKIAKVKRL